MLYGDDSNRINSFIHRHKLKNTAIQKWLFFVIFSSAGYKNAPIVKFETIFLQKSEPILQNESIRILYPFHQLLTNKGQ